MLKSFKEIAQRLRGGPGSVPGPATTATATASTTVAKIASEPQASSADREVETPAEEGAHPRHDPREVFYQSAHSQLASLRTLFAEISRSPDPETRQKTLAELSTEVGLLKTRLGALELAPACQMAAGLEGLIIQLAEKPSDFTPSTLRTAAGALVSLEALCARGVRPDLAGNPAPRFLVVDDDAISRLTVSLALKKFAWSFDVAENGVTALELALRQPYDVVFLDVEMPGMDGYEVCTRIQQTATNRTTPVVFVTSHSSFAARAKSTSSGGKDLIAKPFLTFEITVKALTLLLRNRLEQDKASRAAEATTARGPLAGIAAPAT